jgi:putative redox protein
MDSLVEWSGGKTLTCTDKQGKVMDLGWDGEGVNPVVTTLHSVGACSLIDVVEGLKSRDVTNASVSLELERAEQHPRVFTKIHMVYSVSGIDLPEKLVKRLVAQSHAKYCTVSNMIKHTAEITWEAKVE